MADYFGGHLETPIDAPAPLQVSGLDDFNNSILARAEQVLTARAEAPPVNELRQSMEAFASKTASSDVQAASEFFNWDRSGADRYVNSDYYKELGFDPNINNEEKYGNRQTFGNVASNAFAGAGKLAYNGFVDGWKGWGRIADAVVNLDWDLLKGDEASMRALNKELEDAMNQNAIFSTALSDDTFWNKQTFGNFLQQSGFTVGALGQMLVEQGLTKAIEAGLAATGVGIGAAAGLESVTAAKTAANLGRIAMVSKRAKDYINSAKTFTAFKKMGDVWKQESMIKNVLKGVGSKLPGVDILMDINKATSAASASGKALTALDIAQIGGSGVKRLLSEGNFAFTEARMEAAGTYTDLYNELYYDHVDKFGTTPDADAMAEIASVAQKAADGTFNFNTAVLGVSNRIQFDNVFKGFKANSRLGKLLGSEAAEDLLTVTGKVDGRTVTQHYQKGLFGATGKYRQIKDTFGKATALKEAGFGTLSHLMKWEVSEGVQELLQEGGGTYFGDFYKDMYNTGSGDSSKSLSAALDSQMNLQGLKTFMSGAMTGMLISGPSRIVSKASERGAEKYRDSQATAGMDEAQKSEYFANKANSKGERQAFLDELNTVMLDPSRAFSEVAKNFNIQSEVSQGMSDAAQAKDPYAFHNLKDTALGNLVAKAVRSNTHEGLIDTLEQYAKHFSKEDFEKAFVGLDYSSETKTSAQDYVGSVVSAIKSYQSTYRKFQDKFGDTVNPSLYKPNTMEYREAMLAKKTLDDMIEIVAGNAFKAEQTSKRMESIFEGFAKHKAIAPVLATTLGTLTSPDQMRADISLLEMDIKSMEELASKAPEDKKRLKLKKDMLKTLEQWDALGNKLENTSKARTILEKYLQLVHGEFNLSPLNIEVDSLEEAMIGMIDYTDLQKTNGELVAANNAIMDPANFNKLHTRMTRGAQLANIDLLVQVRELGGDKVDPEVVKEIKTLLAKDNWNPLDYARYEELMAIIITAPEKPVSNDITGRYYTKEQANKLFTVVAPDGTESTTNLPTKEDADKAALELNKVLDEQEEKRQRELDAEEKRKLEAERKAELLKSFLESYEVGGEYYTALGMIRITSIDEKALKAGVLFLEDEHQDNTGNYGLADVDKMIKSAPEKPKEEFFTPEEAREKLLERKGQEGMDDGMKALMLPIFEAMTPEQHLEVIKLLAEGKTTDEVQEIAKLTDQQVFFTSFILGIPFAKPELMPEWIKFAKPLIAALTAKPKGDGPVEQSLEQKIAALEKRREEELKKRAEFDQKGLNSIDPDFEVALGFNVGKKFHHGMNLIVTNTTNHDGYDGRVDAYEAISKIRKQPATDKDGKMIKVAEVEVMIFNTKNDADAYFKERLAKVKAQAQNKQDKINEKFDVELAALKGEKPVEDPILKQIAAIDAAEKSRSVLSASVVEVLKSENLKPAHFEALLAKAATVANPSVKIALETIIKNKQDTSKVEYVKISDLIDDMHAENNTFPNGANLLFEMTATTGMSVTGLADLEKALTAGTQVQIEASTEKRESEERILAAVQAIAPNRKHITYETKAQQKRLLAGMPVITVGSTNTGVNLFAINPVTGHRHAMHFPDKYFVVYPDNRTEEFDFNNAQHRELAMTSFVISGETGSGYVTIEESGRGVTIIDTLHAAQKKIKELKINLIQQIGTAANMGGSETMNVTEAFNKVFSVTAISGPESFSERKAGPLTEFIEQNPGSLTTLTVGAFDVDGNLTGSREISFPLIYRKVSGRWIVQIPNHLTGSGESYINTEGKSQSFADAITSLGIQVSLDAHFPGSHAMILHGAGRKTYPVALKRNLGTEPVVGFLEMMRSIATVLSDKSLSGTKRNIAFNLMNNQGVGFSTRNDWRADFNNNASGNLTIEIKHVDFASKAISHGGKAIRNLKLVIDKSFTNAYFDLISNNSGAFEGLSGDALIQHIDQDPILSQQVRDLYYNMTRHIQTKFVKIKETYSDALAEVSTPLDHYLLMDNENADNSGNWVLKAKNWTLSTSSPETFSVMASKGSKPSVKLSVTMQEEMTTDIVASKKKAARKKPAAPKKKKAPKKKSTAEELAERQRQAGVQTSMFSSAGEPVAPDANSVFEDIEDDAPFSLKGDGGTGMASTQESFQAELDWFQENMPKDFAIGDLADIVTRLNMGDNVLGYYKDQVLYLNQLISSQGTLYHESFHAVFRDLFDNATRAKYRELAFEQIGSVSAARYNQFVESRKLENMSQEQVIDLLAEEWLAEQFKKHMLDNHKPKLSWLQKIFKVIKDLIGFFTKNHNEIDRLFKDIASGAYRNSPVTKEKLSGGTFELANGRPTVRTVTLANGQKKTGLVPTPTTTLIQQQMVGRIAYEMNRLRGEEFADMPFDEKYEITRKKLLAEYSTESLLSGVAPEKHQAALDKYQDLFHEYRFLLGAQVPVKFASDVPNQQVLLSSPNHYTKTESILKAQVKARLNTINVVKTADEIQENNKETDQQNDHEAVEEIKKGGEFDTIMLNPLHGISKEFRDMFSLVPSEHTDPETGVKITKMIDGARIFDGIMKVAANNAPEDIFPAFENALEILKFNNDENYEQFRIMFEHFAKTFDFPKNEKGEFIYQARRNKQLFNQFLDVFYVSEIPAKQARMITNDGLNNVEIKDASLQADITAAFEKIQYGYDRTYAKLSDDKKQQAIDHYKTVFDKYFDQRGVLLKSSDVSNIAFLLNMSEDLHNAIKNLGVEVPIQLVIQSLAAIYMNQYKGLIENERFQSSRAVKIVNAQRGMFREGLYLQADFFNQLNKIHPGLNMFEKTKKGTKLNKDEARTVNMINGILKKAVELIIKYDVGSSVSVFKNGAGKNIYRYTKHTPPGLIAQMVRRDGLKALEEHTDPALYAEWFAKNPMLNASDENAAFLKEFQLSMFSGFRQTLDGTERDGITFGDIDPRTLALSGISFFLNRRTVETAGGKSIVMFDRSRTQEEATTTNFLVSAVYKKRTDADGKITQDTVDMFLKGVEQEYERIAREYKTRNEEGKKLYENYNAVKNEDGTINTEAASLRAYQFRNMDHLFRGDNQGLGQIMIDAAKDGKEYNTIFSEQSEALNNAAKEYLERTFQEYIDKLNSIGVVQKSIMGAITSNIMPHNVKHDYSNTHYSLHGYKSLEDVLRDQHLNIILNKLFVNQLFDGDIAVGINNAVNYYKRNKSGVISGSSLRDGHHRIAWIDELYTYMDPTDLTKAQKDTPEGNFQKAEKVLDGGSMHTMNHRIQMMIKWGKGSDMVLELLKAARYRNLTTEEIVELERQGVVLNAIKSATGTPLYYIKMAEQVLLRPSVSKLVTNGQKEEDVQAILKDLYDRIDVLEDRLLNKNERELEKEIAALYEQVQSFWAPRIEATEMHHLLNSMELSGIDQVFDINSSKKARVLPVKFNPAGITELSQAKEYVPNVFKFLQVETSGVHDHIKLPTQVRQLMTVYLKQTGNDDLVKLADQYSETLGDIARAAQKKIDAILLDDKGNVDMVDLYKAMRQGLEGQGADSNSLKFLELDANGQPVQNINLPMVKKMFVYYYFSFFSKNVFSEEVAGRKDILISGYGRKVIEHNGKIIKAEDYHNAKPGTYPDDEITTRNLGIEVIESIGSDGEVVKTYVVEVMIPKPLFESKEHQEFWEKNAALMFSTRIPTEDKRSMFVAKIVDYIDSSHRNNIVVPQQVHILSGSDLDVDSVYSHVYDIYKDFNGNWHKFGDLSTYEQYYGTKDVDAQFIEYISYMSKDKSLKDLIDQEKAVIDETMDIPRTIEDFYEELGLPEETFDLATIQAKRKEWAAEIARLTPLLPELRGTQKHNFEVYLDTVEENEKRSRNPSGPQPNWELQGILSARLRESKSLNSATLEEVSKLKQGIRFYRQEERRLKRFVALAATLKVLKRRGFPTSKTAYKAYVKKEGSLVIPASQNKSLDQKIAILSHDHVFNNMYINEKSDTKIFEDIAKSIGASVSDVADANAIFTILADMVANEMNSSSKDGIGITASFNKFMAFAEKNQITINSEFPLLTTDKGEHTGFKDVNKDAISIIGRILGMFADGAKDPIPSVLNLNTITAPITNVFLGAGVDLKLAMLMNKVPLIEELVANAINADSAVHTRQSLQENKAFVSLANDHITKNKTLVEVLYSKGKDGKVKYDPITKRPVLRGDLIVRMGEQNDQFVNLENKKMSDLGITVTLPSGEILPDTVAQLYILSKYLEAEAISKDVTKVGSILNLIKSINPSYETLDNIIKNWEYFQGNESMLGGISGAFAQSLEYRPLMDSLRKMDLYSKDVLIERNPLFYAIDKSIKASMNQFEVGKVANRELITDHILKFLLINRFKADAADRFKRMEAAGDNISEFYKEDIRNQQRFFDENYWMDNDFRDDLDYLAEQHQGNIFVDFLRVNNRSGVSVVESLTRLKLEKEVAESLIDAFQALERHPDDRTKLIINKLFYHNVVKDGLGYSGNSFVKYINPMMPEFLKIGQGFTELQQILREQDGSTADEIFKRYFKNDQVSLDNVVNTIIERIGTYDGNKKLRANSQTFDPYKRIGKQVISKDRKDEAIRLLNTMLPETAQRSFAGMTSYINNEYTGEVTMQRRFDAFTPTTDMVDQGFVEINLHVPANADSNLVNAIIGRMGIESTTDASGKKSYSFPSFVTNTKGQLLQLASIDGRMISDMISENNKDFLEGAQYSTNFGFKGKTATYKLTQTSGTRHLLNFAFSKEAGRNLYLNSVKRPEKEAPVVNDDSFEQERAEYENRNKEKPAPYRTYSGKITALGEHQVFVFGANSLGLHGQGSAGDAVDKKRTLAEVKAVPSGTKEKWAVIGQTGLMEGTSGMSYGLVTVIGEPKGRNNPNKISPENLKMNIGKFYQDAKAHPEKSFLVAYDGANPDQINLNGYSSRELASIFGSMTVPGNVVFEKDFYKLVFNPSPVSPATNGSESRVLQMKPGNIKKIREGSKTATARTWQMAAGTYKMPDGTSVLISKGTFYDTISKMRDPEAWARAEGYDSLADMRQNSGFEHIKEFIDGKRGMWVYSIKLAEQTPSAEGAPQQPTPKEAPKSDGPTTFETMTEFTREEKATILRNMMEKINKLTPGSFSSDQAGKLKAIAQINIMFSVIPKEEAIERLKCNL